MPLTIKEMLREPKVGDYWSDDQRPTVLVMAVKETGSVVVITDWVSRGGYHPDFTRAREMSRGEYLEMLEHATQPSFVGRGYRATALMHRWVEIWELDYHRNHALNLMSGDDDDAEERWSTVH